MYMYIAQKLTCNLQRGMYSVSSIHWIGNVAHSIYLLYIGHTVTGFNCLFFFILSLFYKVLPLIFGYMLLVVVFSAYLFTFYFCVNVHHLFNCYK